MIHWSVASELNSTNLLISHFYRYHKNCSRQEKNIVFNSISAFYDEVVSLKIIHFLFISFNWICVFEFAKRKFCVHRRKIQLTTHITHTHTHARYKYSPKCGMIWNIVQSLGVWMTVGDILSFHIYHYFAYQRNAFYAHFLSLLQQRDHTELPIYLYYI